MTTDTAGRGFSMMGRVALVTGGSRGIGAAITKCFVSAGARVAVTHRGTERNRGQSDVLREEVGASNFLAIVADASSDTDSLAAVNQVKQHFGQGIDTLVINAADLEKVPFDDLTVDQWDHMMAVNLRGAFVAAAHVVPHMRQAGYGKIITMGSVMSHIGDPRALHYVTTKGGLIAFSRSLARAEGAAGIRVNCVVPGAIQTERHFEDGGKVELGRLADLQSVQRGGMPEDIGLACQYLASPAGDFVSGQVLTVDGGWSNY